MSWPARDKEGAGTYQVRRSGRLDGVASTSATEIRRRPCTVSSMSSKRGPGVPPTRMPHTNKRALASSSDDAVIASVQPSRWLTALLSSESDPPPPIARNIASRSSSDIDNIRRLLPTNNETVEHDAASA